MVRKKLSAVIATIILMGTSVFANAATTITPLPSLTAFGTTTNSETLVNYLNNAGTTSGGASSTLQAWSAAVASQFNTDESTISGFVSATSANINPLITTYLTDNAATLPSLTVQQADNTAINGDGTPGTGLADIVNGYGTTPGLVQNVSAMPTTIATDITTAGNSVNNAVNTAVASAINAAANGGGTTIDQNIRNAVSGTATSAIASATSSGGTIANAITSGSVNAVTNAINGATPNQALVSAINTVGPQAQGFWFDNSPSTLQTVLNNAGAVATTTNPQTVKLGGGTYTLTNVLSIPANVTLEGAGEAATKIIPTSTFSGTNVYPIEMNVGSALSNVTISWTAIAGAQSVFALMAPTASSRYVLSHVDLEIVDNDSSMPFFTVLGGSTGYTLEVESSLINLPSMSFFSDGFKGGDSAFTLKNNKIIGFGGNNDNKGGCDLMVVNNGFETPTFFANQAQFNQTGGGINWHYCMDSNP